MRFSQSLLQPRPIILPVVNFQSCFRDHEGAEGVYHHGEFFGAFLTNAPLVGSGGRAVGDAAGVEGDVALLDVVAAHKVTVHIIKHLIGVNVGVVVGRRDGFGVVIVETRAK